MAERHQREADRIQTAGEMMMIDLFLRIAADQNVTEWVGLGTARLEGLATSYSNFTTSYLDNQLAILSPAPPALPPPDLSWVRKNIDEWLPSSMVEVNGRVDAGDAIQDILTETTPKIERQVSAFINEVEARTVERALADTEDFWTFDMNRPSAAQVREIGLPLAPNGINVQAGIAELEKYANTPLGSRYPISRSTGKRLRYMIQPQIGACGFCIVRADRLYSVDVLHGARVRSHTHCRCGWRIVTSNEAHTFDSVLRGSKATDIIDRRASPNPNVPVEGDLQP